MTKPIEFLRAILPPDGYYAFVRIKNKRVHQVLVDSLSTVSDIVQAAEANMEDAYFGCASHADKNSRKKDNVHAVKSIWIDLDCGLDTHYHVQQDGLDALFMFCESTGIPTPWVVNSGRGLHVYWPMTESILFTEWETYSSKMLALCAEHELHIKDPGCTVDAARILRVPGTHNYKNPAQPLPVHIMHTGAVLDWVEFKQKVDAAMTAAGIAPSMTLPAKTDRAVDPLTAALAGNMVSSFRKIAQRSLNNAGCGHIASALLNPAETPEPVWRAVLSTAKACEDAGEALYTCISQGHPDFNIHDTMRKVAEIKGPYTCTAYSAVCGSHVCKVCKFNGKITTPLQLGRDVKKAEAPIPMAEVHKPPQLGEGFDDLTDTPAVVLPDLPFPYFRGSQGGIYTPGKPEPDGTTGDPQIVYEYNLDVIRRVVDPERGETLVLHLVLPQDGVKEIMIPAADTGSADRIAPHIGMAGVYGTKEQMTRIANYLIRAAKNLQANTAAEPARSQMGWTEDKNIVWGRSLFTKKGRFYCPASGKSSSVADMMRQTGSFENWERIADTYGDPGMEMQAACILFAFGSMLNPYTYEDPIWLHLVSTHSGSGKTTLIEVLNSIWGSPDAMVMSVKDTVNSLEKRRVVFNSFAMCQDEITNLSPERLSDLAYSQSQAREKHRLTSGSREMANNDRRNNHFITTGNKLIEDALSSFKTNAAGEFARLIQVKFKPLERKLGGRYFGAIKKNYGHAGPRFANWLVRHEDELDQRVEDMRIRFDRDFRSSNSERNWVGLVSGGFAAAHIVQRELGMLRSFNLERIYEEWLTHMEVVRANVRKTIVPHQDVLGDFINENYSNIVIPDSNVAATIDANPETASLYGRKNERDARNRLVIRWEKNTNLIFIAQSELKAYCDKRSHSFAELLEHFSMTRQFKGVVNKRMGSGTGVVTSATKALVFTVDNALGEMLKEDD